MRLLCDDVEKYENVLNLLTDLVPNREFRRAHWIFGVF